MRRLSRGLLPLGTIAIVAGLAKYHARYVGIYDLTDSTRAVWVGLFAVGLIATQYGVGLPDVARTRRAAVTQAIQAAVVPPVGLSVLQLVVGAPLLPRLVVLPAIALVLVWALFCHALARTGRAHEASRDRVLLVADDADAQRLADDIKLGPEHAARLVAVLSPTEAVEQPSEPGAAPRRPLLEQVIEHEATVVVLSNAAQRDDSVVRQAGLLHENGVRVRLLSVFYQQWLGKLPLTELERVSLMFDIGEVHRAAYGRLKRLFDLAVALTLLPVAVLVVPVVVGGNLAANRGPLLYSQIRVGKGGKEFRIHKFRTMRPDAAAPTDWTAADDPRITPFGSVLRRTHLDELPQMWNVIRGDLSIVGPRPEQPQYVRQLSEQLPFYDLRHLVRPGLTGWAQVKYGYAGDNRDALQKLQYEFYYLRYQSFVFDLRVVVRTLRSVLRSEGR